MCFKHREQLIQNGQTTELKKKREIMLTLFSHVLKAVDPYNAVLSHIDNSSLFLRNKTVDVNKFQQVYVFAAGKGSIRMMQAICDHFTIKEGLAITNDKDASVSHENVETIVGGHPVPNEQSVHGAKKAQELLAKCKPDDLVIILISGGGSALLASPRIPLSDLQETTKLLLASGATIQEINTIRKHLSTVKGGQLVQHLPCQVVTFIISDIVGDPLEFISSGPTVGDSTTFSDAYTILNKYKLWHKITDATRHVIEQGKQGLIPETPLPTDPVFSHVTNTIIANNTMACETAFSQAKNLGLHPVMLSTQLTGEARRLGMELFEKATKSYNEHIGNVFISGGEPTVTLKGNGKGGRNQELVLSMVHLLKGSQSVFGSFGTDGIDGMSPAAGAIADGKTAQRAQEKEMDSLHYLENNDSFTYFQALQDTIITGPTGTNVMDVQIFMI